MPTFGDIDVKVEAPARAFMERLQDYLEYLISLGSLTTGEAEGIVQSHWEQLYPGGQILGVPSDTTKLPFYSKVQSWATQQGETYLRDKTQEAEKIQRDIEQREKQVEQDLKYQQRYQAMGETEAMNYANQQRLAWENKQQGIQQAYQQGRMGGLGKTLKELGPKQNIEYPTQPEGGMLSAEQVYYPFLENMSESMKRYYEGKIGTVINKFQTGQPGAREKWWGNLYAPKVSDPSIDEEVTSLQQQLDALSAYKDFTPTTYMDKNLQTAGSFGKASYDITLDKLGEFQAEQAGARADLARYGDGGGVTQPPPQDPLKSYLSKYPFLTEFASLSPQARGFYKSKYAPPTRWLG